MGQRVSAQHTMEVSKDRDEETWMPDLILTEVFLKVPAKDLIRSCSPVCKHWYRVIHSRSLWKQKCQQDLGYSEKILCLLHDEDLRKVYMKNPYKANLIANPDASSGFKYWTVIARGGSGFKTEDIPVGCDPVENFIQGEKTSDKATGCWVTSYGLSGKQQVVDLEKCGVSKNILDKVKPDICISEWYAARFDCGSKYYLQVDLLNSIDGKPLDTFSFEDILSPGRDWYQVSHRFKNYKTGVRYIRYHHQGVDTQFWAGMYGVKMTLSNITIDLEHTSSTYC